jgi:hypothetical protein
VTSKLLEEVVTVLLMYNVDHAVLTPESFENPRIWSRRCRIKTIFELDAATVRLLPRTPNLVLSTSYWSLINGSCQMDTSSAKSQSAPLQNAGPWIYVTEEEVEERLLTNESWLSGLMPEEGHYSTTAADDPATPAPATPMYAQEIYGFESMQGYLDAPEYAHPRTSQDLYPPFSGFATAAPMYPESQQYMNGKNSPPLYPVESPELRPPPSNLSTASGPSASSSTMGPPYSNHGQTVPGPEWNSTGLGINPSIVSGAYDGFAQDFSYTTSGMDHELAFTDVTKSHVFVGECPKVSESSSSVSTFVPSNPMGMIGSLLDRNGSDTSTLRSTQSPRSAITPPSSGSDFFFKSPSTPESSTSPLSKRRFSQSNSSTAGRTQDCRSSPFLSTTQSFQPDVIEQPSYTTTYHRSPFFSQTSGQFIAPLESSCLFPLSFPYTYHSFSLPRQILMKSLRTCGITDPSLIHQYAGAPVSTSVTGGEQIEFQQHHMYPPPQSPTPSNYSAQSSRPIKRSQSPYLNPYQTYPYPQRRPSLMSHASYGSQDGSFDSDENREKGRCPNPECGKLFKDLKAHMLTHQNEGPEKCPIATCDYHIKGFAHKYDKNRHTLTHYKGTMVCGFCPGSGSSAEKSFNRADVFKRHLTSVHAVEQTPPNSRKKTSGGVNAGKKLAGYAPDATGKCSTRSVMFQNAQEFYEHLDDCVLRIVQQEDPSQAINAQRLAEVENDPAVHETLSGRPNQPAPPAAPFNQQSLPNQFVNGAQTGQQQQSQIMANMTPQQQMMIRQRMAQMPGQQGRALNLPSGIIPNEQQAINQIDHLVVPESLLTTNPILRQAPPEVKRWGELKQWISQNPMAQQSNILELVKTYQRMQYQQIMRSRSTNMGSNDMARKAMQNNSRNVYVAAFLKLTAVY